MSPSESVKAVPPLGRFARNRALEFLPWRPFFDFSDTMGKEGPTSFLLATLTTLKRYCLHTSQSKYSSLDVPPVCPNTRVEALPWHMSNTISALFPCAFVQKLSPKLGFKMGCVKRIEVTIETFESESLSSGFLKIGIGDSRKLELAAQYTGVLQKSVSLKLEQELMKLPEKPFRSTKI